MIQIRITLAGGLTTVVAKPTTRETVDFVEFAMRNGMAGIRGIAVFARADNMVEGERVKDYLMDVDLDIRVKKQMDRQLPDLIGVYKLANYPRKEGSQ